MDTDSEEVQQLLKSVKKLILSTTALKKLILETRNDDSQPQHSTLSKSSSQDLQEAQTTQEPKQKEEDGALMEARLRLEREKKLMEERGSKRDIWN